jgi:curved DNA-binding protein CbpA
MMKYMEETGFVDYYELLQISPNAESETIHRVYKMLAQRYHPDNPETGDVDRFLLLNQAFETLTDPALRTSYNAVYQDHRAKPMDVFETKEFAVGVDGESNRRMGILCLLYTRRRSDPEDPGISILEFESIMSFPREHLLFTIWYLKEQSLLRQEENSDYSITAKGIDYVEEHMPNNKMIYRLLKAAEGGSTRASVATETTGASPSA